MAFYTTGNMDRLLIVIPVFVFARDSQDKQDLVFLRAYRHYFVSSGANLHAYPRTGTLP